ncbi:MAG TPA: hypothetical protein VG146_06625 [Verrucomicrobiae bacterium]|nr:hypothetical protein [Verrucomicrobiae bacterium]
MRNSPLTTVLLFILFLSALASLFLCWRYIAYAREFRDLQREVVAVQSRRAFIQSLASETLEYSKRNPAIDPILEGAGLIPPNTGSTSNNKPASK